MTVCYSAVDLCGLQLNRLDCDGMVLSGPTDVVVSCSAVDITVTPVQGGDTDEQRDPNGSRGFCAKREGSTKIESVTVEMTLCSRTDAEMMELLGIWDLVRDAAGDVIGVKSKCCGSTVCACDPGPTTCSNPGVALHLWHLAWLGDEGHPDYKWAMQTIPRVKFDPASVVVTRNSEFNTYTVTGTGNCNDEYGNGPGNIYPDPAGMDSCWAELLTNTGPSDMCDCDRCGYTTTGAIGQ